MNLSRAVHVTDTKLSTPAGLPAPLHCSGLCVVSLDVTDSTASTVRRKQALQQKGNASPDSWMQKLA